VARRSVMTLFSAPADPWSHRTRLVLAEKGIAIELVNVDPNALPEDLIDLNPYHSVPTLVDRDLVLYDSRVIIEYLDERFPHPPLMPIDPVTRAQLHAAEKSHQRRRDDVTMPDTRFAFLQHGDGQRRGGHGRFLAIGVARSCSAHRPVGSAG